MAEDSQNLSNEKRAAVSKTRPSWLPPKDAKEEKKHMKEYRKIIEKAKEQEKARSRTKSEGLLEKDRLFEESTNFWKRALSSNWDDCLSKSSARAHWWAGIPPSLRAQIW